MSDHDDDTTKGQPSDELVPIEKWSTDGPPPLDALAVWEFDVVLVCDWSSCHKDAVRSIAYRHAAEKAHCQVPKAELLCQDHANAVRKAAKNRAEAGRACNHCGETPSDYFDVIVRDELL